MKIDKMPDELSRLVEKFGLKVPKMCYMNSFGLVMQTLAKKDMDVFYVLVTATDNNGKDHPHAIVSYNNKFYDPTLEYQGLVELTRYALIKQFSTDEIIQLMTEKFSTSQIKNMCEGHEPFWPLVHVGENEYEFIDDGSPSITLMPRKNPSLISRILVVLGFRGSVNK